LVLTRKVLTLPKNKFLSKRKRTMTVGTVEIMIAFSVFLQWASGEKSGRIIYIRTLIHAQLLVGLLLITSIEFVR